MPKEVSKAKRRSSSSASSKIAVRKNNKSARNAPLLKLKENLVVEEKPVVQMGGKLKNEQMNVCESEIN
jgi:hypothetical protein